MDKTYNQAIGEKIKTIREAINLTQDDLAKKLGITRPAISNIEQGERKLTAEETFKISKILNTSVAVLRQFQILNKANENLQRKKLLKSLKY